VATALIPARAGSKGIPHKNTRAMCAGKYLYRWTLEAAWQSRMLDSVYIATDHEGVLADEPAAIWSPPQICMDDASTLSVINYHIANSFQDDVYVLLQLTSPLRTATQIDEAIQLLHDTDADCVVSVNRSHHLVWEDGAPSYDLYRRPRKQELEQHQFNENGAIYVWTHSYWKRLHNYVGQGAQLYVMNEETSLQIDSPFDLWLCEKVLLSLR
jgi:CMP-N,N'-diacetyllegionaminic acid synthase